MKKTKNFLRIWITGASVAGFLFGWATFAHAQTPAALAALQSLTTTSSTTNTSTALTTSTQTTVQSFSPSARIRTGGS